MTAPMPSRSLTGVALVSVRFLTQLRENSKLREQYGLVPNIGRDHSLVRVEADRLRLL
jgi:hypothetical protein